MTPKIRVQFPLFALFSLCPFRLVVRTLPFQGKNTGSIPVRDIIHILVLSECHFIDEKQKIVRTKEGGGGCSLDGRAYVLQA